ncbi:hypothetical protein KCP73_10385 [Salmonella enterica subsp. enterica]|nr:hypothetical protein KCP73_10385 [Salmonella enterica subsp. enterica]
MLTPHCAIGHCCQALSSVREISACRRHPEQCLGIAKSIAKPFAVLKLAFKSNRYPGIRRYSAQTPHWRLLSQQRNIRSKAANCHFHGYAGII